MNRLLISALMTAIALAISACSGGGNGYSSTSMTTPLPTATDAFTQTVQSIVVTASETATPLFTDGVAVVAADSASPVAID
jgi:ABC-type Fe3+-hydroxamate transport system substrate-binding protein